MKIIYRIEKSQKMRISREIIAPETREIKRGMIWLFNCTVTDFCRRNKPVAKQNYLHRRCISLFHIGFDVYDDIHYIG